MADEYIKKGDLLRDFDLKLSRWKELKEKGHHDVTHENFIDDVILVLGWVVGDIEKYESCQNVVNNPRERSILCGF
jgi:hypothetical protein